MSNGKAEIILLRVGLIKKDIVTWKWVIFQVIVIVKEIEVELDLSNYATKSDLKNATGVDTSQFAKKMIYLTSNQTLTN